MRQDNVKDDGRANVADQRSPSKRTFVEATQFLPDYDDANPTNSYADVRYNHESPFLEADEDESLNAQMFRGSTCIVSEPHQQPAPAPPPPSQYVIDDRAQQQYGDTATTQPADAYVAHDAYADYCPSDESSWYTQSDRLQRRRSRDSVDNDLSLMQPDDHNRRRPETMRSISEDTQSRNAKQTIPRRTYSHPEPDMQSVRRNELPPKLPSFSPFGDMKERKKPSKLPSPRCKNFKSTDVYDTSPSSGECFRYGIDIRFSMQSTAEACVLTNQRDVRLVAFVSFCCPSSEYHLHNFDDERNFEALRQQ